MAVVKSGQGSLLKTKIQILVGLHCCELRLQLRGSIRLVLVQCEDLESWNLSFDTWKVGCYFTCLCVLLIVSAKPSMLVVEGKEEGQLELPHDEGTELSFQGPKLAGDCRRPKHGPTFTVTRSCVSGRGVWDSQLQINDKHLIVPLQGKYAKTRSE